MNKSRKGFTLIELLIVIVIIGILSGVLIAVINPFRQQSRAKNATLRASINKVAFGVNTTRAGIGRLPAETELDTELENLTVEDDCVTVDTLDCSYQISGTTTPDTCTAADPVSGDSGASSGVQCEWNIVSTGSGLVAGNFRIGVKKFKLDPADSPEIYVFDSSTGLFECPNSVAWTNGSNELEADLNCTQVTE